MQEALYGELTHMFNAFTASSQLSTLEARLARIERKLDAVMRHLDLDSDAEHSQIDEEVMELIRQGKKLQAVKMYRQTTGSSLAEAKRHVDSLIGNRP